MLQYHQLHLFIFIEIIIMFNMIRSKHQHGTQESFQQKLWNIINLNQSYESDHHHQHSIRSPSSSSSSSSLLSSIINHQLSVNKNENKKSFLYIKCFAINIVTLSLLLPTISTVILSMVNQVLKPLIQPRPSIPKFEQAISESHFWKTIEQLKQKQLIKMKRKQQFNNYDNDDDQQQKSNWIKRLFQALLQYWYIWLLIFIILSVVLFVILIESNNKYYYYDHDHEILPTSQIRFNIIKKIKKRKKGKVMNNKFYKKLKL